MGRDDRIHFTSPQTQNSLSSRASPSGSPAWRLASVPHRSPNGLFRYSWDTSGWLPLQKRKTAFRYIQNHMESLVNVHVQWSEVEDVCGRWLIINKEKATHQWLPACLLYLFDLLWRKCQRQDVCGAEPGLNMSADRNYRPVSSSSWADPALQCWTSSSGHVCGAFPAASMFNK